MLQVKELITKYKKVWRCLLVFVWAQLGCLSASAEINNNTLAILVNKNDPESIEIAKHYQQARYIPAENVIYLSFKSNVDALSKDDFKDIEKQLREKVTDNIQGYALAWRKPWRVGCMSVTSAFSLGYSEDYCAQGCRATKLSPYFNSQTNRPFTDYDIRPSMLLSASSVDEVKRLIDRGVSSDYMRSDGTAYLLSTGDKQRNVRASYFPLIESLLRRLINIKQIEADAIKNKTDVMFYFTGLPKVRFISMNRFLPGAIADHLTSSGGHLFKGRQMSVLDWIDAGVTGTYGTVVEPCNFVQKFPNPGVVMQEYLTGSTLLEAYWKSVQMPGQGVFVGEPLASPYKGCMARVNQQNELQYIQRVTRNYVEQSSRKCSRF